MSSVQTTVLHLGEVSKVYASVTAVDQISFSIQTGEIIGLLGPNGAGKSTTINMILGILEPTSGQIHVFGRPVGEERTAIAEQINFAAVYAHVPLNLTVRQNLLVFARLYNVAQPAIRVEALLKQFDLERFADSKSGLLSSGELSRLNLAKAVINQPKLLLLDEPTASLDPSIAEMVRERIRHYVKEQDAAVLWTSHNMREIEAVCDRVLFLSHGKILLSGNPRTVAAEYGKRDLEELFISVAREPLSLREE